MKWRVAISKFGEGLNILTLSEQQYFVWDTASRSTKPHNLLEFFFGGQATLAPWLRLCQIIYGDLWRATATWRTERRSSTHHTIYSAVPCSLCWALCEFPRFRILCRRYRASSGSSWFSSLEARPLFLELAGKVKGRNVTFQRGKHVLWGTEHWRNLRRGRTAYRNEHQQRRDLGDSSY